MKMVNRINRTIGYLYYYHLWKKADRNSRKFEIGSSEWKSWAILRNSAEVRLNNLRDGRVM